MKKLYVLFIALLAFNGNAQDLWRRATTFETASAPKYIRTSNPVAPQLYQLDLAQFKQSLTAAPLVNSGLEGVTIAFPDAWGNLLHFKVYYAPVLHPALATKFPDNRSYIGQCIEHPTSTIRFSVTLFGLHAIILAANDGTYYIDPYTKTGNFYWIYAKKGLTTTRPFECLVDDQKVDALPPPVFSDPVVHRTYRTAICCTVEYSAFNIAQAGVESGTLEEKKAAVMAAIAVTITRVNSMFERDLSVFMELVPNNDLLVFIDSDNLTNDDVGALIDEGQALMNELIGTENYDFGHSFGTSGGGLGGGSPCAEGSKAVGATGLGAPIGDPFDIDYVAHEMGHQFGAAHTFNNSCGGNRSDEWAYEPGSGSSIMAYAGICDPNIQAHSDAQFFAGSIAQIRSRINGNGGSCAAQTTNGNHAPIANAGNDYVIPKGTAFVLTGSAGDADGDAMLYTWEQYDNEITAQPPAVDATAGPSFKPQLLTDVPVRYLPDLADILGNNLAPTWEVVSTVGRQYHFAFTARDNHLGGGDSHTDFMQVTASNTAGPFVVTAPNTAVDWTVGSNQEVTWDVAGTTANGVDCATVDIVLSTDGGAHFDQILASNVPNDGAQTILVPNSVSLQARLMVRGHGNIFLDVSDEPFTISASGATYTMGVSGSQLQSVCRGNSTAFSVAYQTVNGFSSQTDFSVSGLPTGVTASFDPVSTTADAMNILSLATDATAVPGLYELTVTGTSGSEVKNVSVYLEILNADFAPTVTLDPSNGSNAVPVMAQLTWQADPVATSYLVTIYDDTQAVLIESAIVQDTTYLAQFLTESATYYWTVTPMNAGCSGMPGALSQFATGVTLCTEYISPQVPVVIPADDAATVTSTLEVTDDFPISRVSVNVNIPHDWVGDLTVTLVSPNGTEVQLFSQECWDGDDVVATFSDQGTAQECGSPIALSGNLLPDAPLSTLNGQSATGTWTLRVFDEFPADGGSIDAWSLNLCHYESTLATVQPAFAKDLALFPNPNDGNFTVSGAGLQDGKYTLEIFDISGRRVTARTAQATAGRIHENFALPVASGFYVLKMGDGQQTATRKFIVK